MNKRNLKITLTIAILLASLFIVNLRTATAEPSAPAAVAWQKTYSFGQSTSFVRQTSDGGYVFYTLSKYYNNDDQSSRGELVKIDSSGNIEWTKALESIQPNCLIATKDGGFAYTILNANHIIISKLSSTGEIQWTQTSKTTVSTTGIICETQDGGYTIAVNNFTSTVHFPEGGGADVNTLIVLKTDSSGRNQWVKTYNVPGLKNVFQSIVATKDGGCAIGGSSGVSVSDRVVSESVNGSDFCLVKITRDGQLSWIRTYGGSNDDDASILLQTKDDNYLIGGETRSFGSIKQDGTKSINNWLLLKVDSTGILLWAQTYEGSINSVVETKEGGLALAGSTDYSYTTMANLALTDEYGNLLRNQIYYNATLQKQSSEYFWGFNAMLQSIDGSFIMVGKAQYSIYHEDESDCYIVKTVPESTQTSSHPVSTASMSLPIITIKPNGTIDPPNAPLTCNGNIYDLTQDFHGGIIVQKNDVTLDGQGHWLFGNGSIGSLNVLLSQVGIDLTATRNVKVQNFAVGNFMFAMWLNHTNKATFTGNNLSHNGQGIFIDSSDGIDISGNRIVGGTEGVHCIFCIDTQISDNTLQNEDTSVTLRNCNETRINNNKVTQSFIDQLFVGAMMTGANGGGLYVEHSFNCVISGNSFLNNWEGLGLTTSTGVIVVGNDFTKCNVAISGGETGDSLIYLNNFIDSTWPNDFFFDEYGNNLPFNGTNHWDNGVFGNYWSNYTQTYPNAKQVGNSGTWNTPYLIKGKNVDYHPLQTPVTATAGFDTTWPYPSPTMNPTPTLTEAPTDSQTPTSSPVPKASDLIAYITAAALASIAIIVLILKIKRKHIK